MLRRRLKARETPVRITTEPLAFDIPSIVGAILDKVVGPGLVAVLGTQPDSPTRRQIRS